MGRVTGEQERGEKNQEQRPVRATEAWDAARHRSAGERAPRLFQLGFDQGPDSRQAFRGRGLEPEHERGLGVRGPDQAPPVIEDHSDPVDRDHLADRGACIATRGAGLGALHESRLHALDEVELERVRTVHPNLRRDRCNRQIRDQRGKRLPGLGQDLDQPAGGVDRIVIAEIPVRKKHVPGHLPGQHGRLGLHLGLDQRMAGLPHDRAAPVLLDVNIQKHGGRPIMWKTGHSLIKAKMKAESAVLAGEMSGHMFFADRYFGYDDAIYASCRLIEILAKTGKPLSSLIADLPVTSVTPEIRVDCPDTLKFDLVKRVQARFVERAKSRPARRDAGPAIREVVTIDGVRVVFDDGWGLIRASSTQPALVLRFEASSPERLAAIRTLIESELEESRRAFAR